MQEELDLLTGHQTRRQLDLAVAPPEGQVEQIGLLLALAASGQRLPGRSIMEDVTVPVGRTQRALDLVRRQAARVGGTDGRARTGARNAIDRDPQGLQDTQHADMGEAARAAA